MCFINFPLFPNPDKYALKSKNDLYTFALSNPFIDECRDHQIFDIRAFEAPLPKPEKQGPVLQHLFLLASGENSRQ